MSAETKVGHTPGPWEAHKHGEGWWSVLRGAWDVSHNHASAPGFVADARYSVMTPAENEANARLIAAAPDLLEALKEVRRLVKMCGCEVPGYVERAIAKAEGEVDED